jgi:integrase
MTTGRITKRAVDAAKARSTDTYIWDHDLPGFGLKVTPAGRKVYLVQYRLGGRKGRTRRVTMGQHGAVTPTQARVEAKRLLGEISAGRDPAEDQDKERADKSVKAVFELFMAEHVKKLKTSSAEEYRSLARLHILPQLGNRLVGEVKRTHVAQLHHRLSGTPYQGNRSLALLSKFFNWCEKHGYRADGSNPSRHVQRYRETRRERFLSQAELARLGDALRKAEHDGSCSLWAIAAIRLLALTGARRNEILTLRWEHVNEEHGSLMLPDSKTGRKVVHLSPAARTVLAGVSRVSGNPFVICGEKTGQPIRNIERPWQRVRAEAGLDGVRLHDLRHSFASVAALGGTSLLVIGRLLGHTQPTTTARYAHLADDPLKAANDAIGQRIASAMDGSVPGEIVDLPKARPKVVRP